MVKIPEWPTYPSGNPIGIGDTVHINSSDPAVNGRMGIVESVTFRDGICPRINVHVGSRNKPERLFAEELEEA